MHITNFLPKVIFSKTVLVSSLLIMSGFTMAEDMHSQHHMHHTDTQKPSSNKMNDSAEMDHSSMSHASMTHSAINHASVDHDEMKHETKHETKKGIDDVQMKPAVNHESVDHRHHQQSFETHSNGDNSSSLHQHNQHMEKESQVPHHQGHDHRAEHGGQIYAMTTLDNKWLIDEEGKGALKSELETRIGTDENKLFIKLHADKHESQDTEFDAKVLYSRMISDFWDAQLGARYRSEKFKLDQSHTDTEEKLDAVIGLHGMAPYFFETDTYLYVGEDNFSALSLETERDLLLTQKLIAKPYLNLDIVLSDDSKYAKKSGFSQAIAGLETRYEISKKIMPYLDIAYQYSKGNKNTDWQVESDSETGWQYGAGIRFKF